MPFKSKSQARFMFAKYPAIAKEFSASTGNMKALPEKVSKKKKKINNIGNMKRGA